MKHVAIVGAGIAGLLPAYFLSKQGHAVTVYEQEAYPAMKCSYANGGQLSVSNSEVWTTWNNVWKGLKWITKKDAPLLIRPSLDWQKALWITKFLYHTAKNDHARRTAETIHMGLAARKIYQDIIDAENLSFDQNNCGILHIYKNKKTLDAALKIKDVYEQNGCEWNILNFKEIIDIEPALQYNQNIVGGAWTPSDWVGDIHKFCVELSRILSEKYRVTFMFNWPIADINLYAHDYVVIAAGSESYKLAKTFGDSIPVYPVKGYSITIPAEDIKSYNGMPKVSLLDDEAKIVSSTLGSRLRVAGTAELAGENYDIKRDRVNPLLNWVRDNFSEVSRKNYSSWSCLRPMTPDMMPLVGPSKINKKVFYHTGHGHLGWTLSPYTAQKLAQMISKA